MKQYKLKTTKIEQKAVDTYKKIEEGVDIRPLKTQLLGRIKKLKISL